MKTNQPARLLLILTGLIILLPVISFAQVSERKISKISWRTEPVKILKLKTKNKDVELGRKFLEEDDWLNGLAVTVQNISEKAIARIELGLAFPPPKGSPPEKPYLLIRIGFGREPEISPAGAVQKLVLPTESVEIKLPDANIPGIKLGLEKLGYPEKIGQVEISVKSGTFVDGSEWVGDEMLYPNPNNPKEKINPNRSSPEPYKPPQFSRQNATCNHEHDLDKKKGRWG